jgi:hypothetical protein
VTQLLERMREELVRRNYPESTIRSYLRIISDFQLYNGKHLDRLGPDDVRRYHAYLLEERKLAVRTVARGRDSLPLLQDAQTAGHERRPVLPPKLSASVTRDPERSHSTGRRPANRIQ